MKNLLYFLLFAAMLTLNSCSQDEDSPEKEPSLVLGEWYTEDIIISGTSTETRDGQTVTTRYWGNSGPEEDSGIIFTDDNKYSREGSYNIMFKSRVNDGDLLMELVVYAYRIIEGTYLLEDNKINFYSNQEFQSNGPVIDPRNSFESIIIELTANRMVIFMEQQEISYVNGAEIENEYEMTQIFWR